MKILHTGMGWFSEEAGGLSRYMSQALVAQSNAGHSVSGLVTGTPDVGNASKGLAIPFAARGDRMDKRLAGLRRTYRMALAEKSPDISTFHFALYGRPILDLVRKRAWVMHFHGPWALEGRAEGVAPWKAWIRQHLIEQPFYRAAPRLVTLSNCFAGILQNTYGILPNRIRVVPGGFDPGPFEAAPSRHEARLRLGFPMDRPIVVCVRRLASRMGLENLIDAVGLLRGSTPNLLVAIAGRGPLQAILEGRIKQAGLEDNIRLLGFVPDGDLPSLYAAGDLSVVPTVSLEGFGLIVAESLASGTPVVASKVGALPELLGGFAEPMLAAPTPQGLAGVLAAALDKKIQVPSAEHCRLHARQWSWERVTPQLIGVYAEAFEEIRSKAAPRPG